jgi:hypothetical protein
MCTLWSTLKFQKRHITDDDINKAIMRLTTETMVSKVTNNVMKDATDRHIRGPKTVIRLQESVKNT